MKLDGIRQKVFLDRYALKDKQGKPVEKTPDEMWKRVAKGVARAEKPALRKKWEKKFYEAMQDFKFVPGGRILAGAGTGFDVTFYNCFVLPSPKDSRDGILDNLKAMIEIMARGGGVGLNLSSLRPRGARVKKVNGFSSGPCNWAELYSLATHDIVQQGGCFSPQARIMTHKGLVPIAEIVDGKSNYFAFTHKGFKKITARFNNGTKDTYEVKTEAGFRVSVTAEHKFLTFNKNGEFYLKKLSDFKEGENMAFLLGDWSKDLPYVSLNNTLLSPSKYSYGLKEIVLPKVLNEDLAFIMGAYDSDGSRIPDEYSKNGKGIRIAVADDKPRDLKTLISALERCFGVEPKMRKGDGAVTVVQVFSRRLNEFLKMNNLLKEYSVNVRVPEQIYTSPKSVVEAYIAGVFMGDGTNRGGKGGLRIATVSQGFSEDLHLLLLNLGIPSKIKVQDRSKEGWRTLYTVTVNGKTFMQKFIQLLSPYTQKSFDNKASVRDGFFGWPVNMVERFLYVQNYQRTCARTNPTTSQKSVMFLQQMGPVLQEADKTDVELLASLVPDKIAAINYAGKENVYDLEVEDVHLLSGNGFYTSNSRRGALMIMLWDWHPDIEEFITVKQDLRRITGANLSVAVSDKFMEAVKKDEDWNLVFPDLDDPEYDKKWDGVLDHWLKLKKKVKVHKTIKARALWDLICDSAWKSAEPGVVFMERYNKWYNNWYWNTVNCVNPCVTGDTLVATSKGLLKIGELYQTKQPFIALVEGESYLSSPVKSSGVKKVYRLKTKEGYELRLTFDHKVYTKNGKIEAGKLKKGDKIQVSFGPAFGTRGTLDEGRVLGWLVGDGSVKKDVATLFFYKKEKQELAPSFAMMVDKMVEGEQIVQRAYPILPQYIEKEDKAVIESVRLWRIANRYGITHENKYVVPRDVLCGSNDLQKGFLQGLFSSDGSVQGNLKKGVSVRLTSVSKSLLVETQRLLLNFGILSKIYFNRRLAQERFLPDGKGGSKAYKCQAYHELIISRENLMRFAALIGFLQEEKQEKLTSLTTLYQRGPYKQEFIATFDSLEEDGIEEVFDITVDKVHRFSANGLIVSNCGEEGLPAWGVCNLGSLNLSAFVKGYSVDKAGEMDYKSLIEHAKIAARFQDDVIDIDSYVFPEIKEVQLNGERRIGLGTMGLGDALIKMHIRYGSDQSLKVIDKIFKTIRDAAYEASSENAKDKKPFPKFNASKYLQGHFVEKLPSEVKNKIKKNGIRNSLLLQEAPTGSTSLLSGVSSGIEPVYEFEFIRRDRLGEHLMYHPLYEEWKKSPSASSLRESSGQAGQAQRPDYFASANDLTPEDHVKVQAAIQEYVDASISKTVNAPKTHTVSDVKKLYTLAYDLGCKGIAYMREGSREGVLTRLDAQAKEEEKPKEIKKAYRPMQLEGVTYMTETPVGRTYITINHNEEKEPFEVFITIGKSGSDVAAMADALGRMISLNLRLNGALPARERIRQVVSQLAGIGGGRSVGFGKERVRSLPDAVAKVLAKHFGFVVNGRVEDKKKEEGKNQEKEALKNGEATGGHTKNGENHDIVMLEQLSLGGSSEHLSSTSLFDICPECGSGSLAYEEGCRKCYSCGYSEC